EVYKTVMNMKAKHTNPQHLFFLSIILCLSSMFSSLKTYAQDNELLDKVWYLYKLNVNGTKVDYPLIESLNGKESTIEFLDNSIIQFSGCPSFSYCTIEYEVSDNQTFIFQSLGCLDMDLCENLRYYYPDYEIFEILLAEFYYSILPSADTSSLQNLSYTINVENNYFNLKLINENQDVAYYSTENLSTPDFEILNSSIYPNPVQDQLFIRLED